MFQNPFYRPTPGIPPEIFLLLQQMAASKGQETPMQASLKKYGDAMKKAMGMGGAGAAGGAAAAGGSSVGTALAAPQIVSASKIGGMSVGAPASFGTQPVSSYAAMTGGPGSLAYWAGPAAFIASAPAWAPVVGKGLTKLSKKVFGDKDADRVYRSEDAAKSRVLERNLPGFASKSEEERRALGDKINSLGIMSLPGREGEVRPTIEGDVGINYNKFVRDPATRERLEDKFGRFWQRTTPLEEVMKFVPQASLKKDFREGLNSLTKEPATSTPAQRPTGYNFTPMPNLDVDPGFSASADFKIPTDIEEYFKGTVPAGIPRGPTGAQPGPVQMQQRTSTLSPGIGLDGRPINYGRR